MDTVVTENLLEFYPNDSPDAVVLANVLEPYPAEVRRLLFAHVHHFLRPGGQIIVAVTIGETGLGTASESVLDLIFPSVFA
ncbi:DNMT3A [Symbiodinium pilosum]|uniref:DNMT3A protein n=1 Tax=Symbiodinium pilosum TaxID=2952 RepID=A0A812V616_SYMPI|nr:DNMT3A [Symbiodinium pilosum]